MQAVQGKLFINGELVSSKEGELFDVINPATEEVIDKGVAATKEDVDEAVSAARNAFDDVWSKTDAVVRGKYLYKLAELI